MNDPHSKFLNLSPRFGATFDRLGKTITGGGKGGNSSPPPPPQAPEAPAPVPIIQTSQVQARRVVPVTPKAPKNQDTKGDNRTLDEQKKRRMSVDRESTILTGGQGVTNGTQSAKKTLLGGG